ncbi:MAG: four helix bundle protein [Deltaproteobacteria bacterium]|nr:four helix bundle protein [Deltaproteobacteria bacterium]
MAKYKSFEDLAVQIYKLTSRGKIDKDFALKGQMQRAAISISSNIAEGFERGSKKEFIQFLYIAKGSCGELRSQIIVIKDLGFLEDNDFSDALSSAVDISRQINGFIEYLKKSELKGQKFK